MCVCVAAWLAVGGARGLRRCWWRAPTDELRLAAPRHSEDSTVDEVVDVEVGSRSFGGTIKCHGAERARHRGAHQFHLITLGVPFFYSPYYIIAGQRLVDARAPYRLFALSSSPHVGEGRGEVLGGGGVWHCIDASAHVSRTAPQRWRLLALRARRVCVQVTLEHWHSA